ncbi:MAG: hypothetical protein U9M97_03065 [Candidatus Hadarchaeota archaeon]|nr:hypothetical protein [Candidatus Hadarchaeota archaeon]
MVRTSGTFKVTWDEPLFYEENMAPGDEAEAKVLVSNLADEDQPLKMKMEPTKDTKLSSQLKFSVLRDSKILWEGNLEDLFSKEKELLTLKPKEDADLTLRVEFDEKAGNEYQGKKVSFDLTLGLVRVPVILGAEKEKPRKGAVLGAAIGGLPVTGGDIYQALMGCLSLGFLLKLRRKQNLL